MQNNNNTNHTTNDLIKKKVELTTLYEIAKSLSTYTSPEPEEILGSILEILSANMGMRHGTITLLDPATKQLYIEVAHGLTDEEKGRGVYNIGEGITGRVVATGEPAIIPDIGKEPLFLDRTKSRGDLTEKTISFISVPIQVKGETIGVLSVDRLPLTHPSPPRGKGKSVEEGEYKSHKESLEEDMRVLTIVASLIGQTITIAKMVELEKKSLIKEKLILQRELKSPYRFANIVFQSDKMREVLDSAWRVSQSKATVLIRGESGTGKELIARAIHYHSKRCDKPFISINCAAIPYTLIESELFGHEKGAFTGAIQTKKGRFELADTGTLFLDEIGDIPISTQVKLLRVLQEKKFERVGGSKSIIVDVRIITATNKDLEEAVRRSEFREDLYYRLNVVPIRIPALRDRKEDIPPLVGHFLQIYNEENSREVKISNEALDTLLMYDWPGNVRELENCVERMIVMSKNEIIMAEDIPVNIGINSTSNKSVENTGAGNIKTLDRTVEEMEKEKILDALKRCGYVQAKAARQLGITSRQIGYKMKKYGIGEND
ncbi:MAG: nif-specific transcriptional activator NifA [Nitrospirae bacterium]|nr:nif-specific transcriptional activator NifA [Nitrospirota bacterium]